MPQLIPSLSIIIPAFNEEKFIGPCLEAIRGQTVTPDEVIVVNNNSSDKTVDIATSYPFVTLISETEQGMIPARDTGFNHAKGKLLARIDADTRIPANWVESVHKLLDSKCDSIFGLSGPQYFYDLPSGYTRNIVSAITSRYGFFGVTRIMLGHETLFGSNMVITRKAWMKVKKEVCHNGQKVHEDIDLALHIGKYGTIIFDKKLLVGISSRAFFESLTKHIWRLRVWTETITRHRKLFKFKN